MRMQWIKLENLKLKNKDNLKNAKLRKKKQIYFKFILEKYCIKLNWQECKGINSSAIISINSFDMRYYYLLHFR